MINEINKYQIGIMKHCISDKGRNWFATSDQTKDCCAFNDLVKKGFATKRTAPSFWGDDWIFSLTEKGIDIVNDSNDE